MFRIEGVIINVHYYRYLDKYLKGIHLFKEIKLKLKQAF